MRNVLRVKNKEETNTEKIDPKVKDALILLGTGSFLAASLVMPGLPLVLKPFLHRERQREDWKKFNPWRLKQIIKRLHQQKLVEIKEEDDLQVVRVTEKGKQRLLKFQLDDLQLKEERWDGKWRIIIYDIFSKKRQQRNLFQRTLKRLKFLQLQRSVYLTPFSCHDEIEYLRQVCDVGQEVIILTVSNLENEEIYKEYFGLD